MIVAISGATGLVGSALPTKLESGGHEIRRLVRSAPSRSSDISWDPAAATIDEGALGRVDAVIHLAGESIAAGRWSGARKRRIRDSRVMGTTLLARKLARLGSGPRTLICASAIGYYGDRADEELTEQSARGSGFLAEVCEEWERAADAAREAGLRVVHLRLGIVLSKQGGALQRMLLPFKMGAGGNMGDGRQWWAWIGIEDVASAFAWALESKQAAGVYNCVSPQPLRNAEFTRQLGAALKRPTILPLPAFAVRLLLGEMGEQLLLSSARVLPQRLQEQGFQFASPTLDLALRRQLQ